MDSYPTLLSPIDSFSFSHFSSSPTHNTVTCDKQRSTSPQPALPQTPLPKSSSDWHELLDGPQLGQLSFYPWESDVFGQSLDSSPWQPHIFRSLSDSYVDSPLSSSSFLSSTTCSPWETCPGLAPASPEFPVLNDLNSQYPRALHFGSADESSMHAFSGLSLGSPLRSPILLSFRSERGLAEPFNLIDSQNTTNAIDTSNLMVNALALDLSVDRLAGQSPDSQSLLTFGNDLVTSPQSKSTSPLSDLAESPSPAGSALSHTEENVELALPPYAGLPSESYLQDRVTRRKTSHVDYSEEAYDGDSDDDYEEGTDDDSTRFAKRRKSSASGAVFHDSDDEPSEEGHWGTGRGRRHGIKGSGRGKAGNASVGPKRKCKRRHYCPRDGCQSSFTRVTDMERHVASVHRASDTDANRCSFCRKAFSREDAVLRHENDSCRIRKKKPVERWT